jgi:protein SCO1/2
MDLCGTILALLSLGSALEVSSPDEQPRTGGAVSGSSLAVIGPAPKTELTDQDGKSFSLEHLRGKAVVVSFVYTTCSGVCPATTHRLTRVQQELEKAGLWGGQVEFVSISLDPARDTPAVLSGYARVYDCDTRSWHFLTGAPAEVARVVAAWGMWARVGPSGTLDHPSRIFLLDPKGRQREIYNLDFLQPETVTRDVKAVLGGTQ